jgi:predicted phosphodiesterase
MTTQFTLAHISDLHFSAGADKAEQHHKHSILHLEKLQQKLKTIEFDRLIVSGDISNMGDKESLLRAHDYIYGKFAIGGGEATGLELSSDKVWVVPGNHDAWNKGTHGSPMEIWQRSLKNYNDVFVEHKPSSPLGCYYEWLEKDGCYVFMAFVDSCYLGDVDYSEELYPVIKLSKIARGKLSLDQSTLLLEWFDKGVKGLLQNPNDSEQVIPKEQFANSLKILVMHHYLFEPPEFAYDYLMSVKHRNVVFSNIAMADFDMLLCGHKHIQDYKPSSYGDHFDQRGKDRYLINYFRRLIGIHSLPVQYSDDKGRLFSKALSRLINILVVNFHKQYNVQNTNYLDELGDMLIKALKNPEELEQNIRELLKSYRLEGEEIIDSRELKEIRARISTGLTMQDRNELEKVAKKFNQILKHLGSRPFLQVMCGSTTKASSDPNKQRSFNVYKIEKVDRGTKFRIERYRWESQAKAFSDEPLVYEHSFDRERVLVSR